MPRITFVERSGVENVVDGKIGQSVMEAAVRNNVPGIAADCGGACSCATCHVYVPPEWYGKLEPINESEGGMLIFASEPRANSRLSCQIVITAALDGLVVNLPTSQH